jgi:hypothetical protein
LGIILGIVTPGAFRVKRALVRRVSPSTKLPHSVRDTHQEHFSLIARGAMVGKQIKSLFVRLEQHEPHIPTA